MFSVKGKEYRVVRIREDEPFKVNDIVVAIESGTEVPYCVPKDIYGEEKKFYNYDTRGKSTECVAIRWYHGPNNFCPLF